MPPTPSSRAWWGGSRAWWGGVWSTVVVPLLVAGFTLGGTQWSDRYGQPAARPVDALAVVLLLAGPALLVVRRARPGLVLGLVAAVLITYLALGYPVGPVFVASLFALAEAVSAGRRVVAYTVTAVTFTAAVSAYALTHPTTAIPLSAIGGWTASLVAFVAGCELRRSRRERLEQAREARREAERRRAGEERLEMARELHDALGHHLSLINVQAGVALYLMDDDPEQARRALATIKKSSRELLREMRATLGVLRGVDEPSREPVAGLARLDALVVENGQAGLPVTVHTHGSPRDLPAGVDLAAYRIVQEALTNTRRHAAADSATVLLGYDDEGLTIEVTDDGTASSAPGGGNGLPGMRERAAALGGTFTAGPGPEGGFRVRAHLPTAREEATP
ncbi:sensor histidine kinase [Pseudonocardia abyssalis]|uniref:histidine kinase n=1 Tax=Pseudonocardia abyssalis TaxID=2792008 RepID=A0ABS6UPW9_9PSEU|nr:sensor histidine kinase [Pseudonocardia abyssalis]MBW0119362.1 sensor histidine kinase [Pseudonocardia abyssalis]MBW0134303.1 sensor histidine kinase [Pseudonocardia abyssalis]